MQAHDVGLLQQLVQRDVAEAEHLGQDPGRPHVVGDDFHAEALGDPDDVEPNAARADHAEGLALQVESLQAGQREVAALCADVSAVDVTGKRQDEPEGVLGDGRLAVVGDVRHDDAALGAGRKVDVVVAGRAGGDQAQPG